MNSNEKIKEALIKSCIKSESSYFKPYLNLEEVTCDPDKERFFIFFRYMLFVSRKISKGDLHLKIELVDPEDITVQHYKFFDFVHLHPRLTVIVEESNDSIHLDILPF